MKKLLLSLTLASLVLFASSQTALDWTKNDCNGINHQLFSELDSGFTIISVYDMVPFCTLCITAANSIKTIRDGYEVTNPGKVRWYATGFLDSYTCSQMTDWASDNDLTPNAEFITGATEVAHYGGMGMPTIVVLGGGTSHTVYYSHLGYTSSQDDDIIAAVDESLSAISGVNNIFGNEFSLSIYPNPASTSTSLTYMLNEKNETVIELYNLVGKKILTLDQGIQTPGKHDVKFDVSIMNAGVYFAKLNSGTNSAVASLKVVH